MKKIEINWQNNDRCFVGLDDENCPIVYDKKSDKLYRLVLDASMYGFSVECFKGRELEWRSNLGLDELEALNQQEAKLPIIANKRSQSLD